ncbi:hypothetical protein CEXT_70891 [Caerostris extrusa]|uniref:Uncharacterized protein n=1 Tax=Caerostris extrusa TaxID=172846 RepID=A0AAV4RFN8_CAEEX|nr:hypothetical protein CEXT_70891 [Caerostris extrusa]
MKLFNLMDVPPIMVRYKNKPEINISFALANFGFPANSDVHGHRKINAALIMEKISARSKKKTKHLNELFHSSKNCNYRRDVKMRGTSCLSKAHSKPYYQLPPDGAMPDLAEHQGQASQDFR